MLKNFFNTLKHYSLFSLLNITGLAIAMASSYVLFVQSFYALNYNADIKDSERVFRMEQKFMREDNYSIFWNVPMVDFCLSGNPTVETYYYGNIMPRPISHTFEKLQDNPMELIGLEFSEEGIEVFGFELVYGDWEPVMARQGLAISRSVSEKYGINVGDFVCTNSKYIPEQAQVVSAIFEDFPENSDLGTLQTAFGEYWDFYEEMKSQPQNWNYPCLVKLHNENDVEAFMDYAWQNMQKDEKMKAQLDEKGITKETFGATLRLTPLNETYFQTNVDYSINSGNRISTYVMLLIAVLILVLAFINFFNFYVALVPKRIKNINMYKIMGAKTSVLRMSMIFDAVMMSFVAMAIASYIVYAVESSIISSVLSSSLAFGNNKTLVIVFFSMIVILSVVTSLYPAWYVTSFSPAFTIKGNFGATSSGKILRNVLIGIQFVVTFVFILITSLVYSQYTFMQNYDLGFDKKNVISFNLGAVSYNHTLSANRETVRSAFMSNPNILDVTFGYENLVSIHGMHFHRFHSGSNTDISFKVYPVHHNFLKVMGIDIVEGRDFTENDALMGGRYIFNMTAKKQYSIALGDVFHENGKECEVIGFCNDFNFRPLQYPMGPYAFFILPPDNENAGLGYLYIKIKENCNIPEVFQFLKNEVMKLNPNLTSLSKNPSLFEKELDKSFYDKEYNEFVIVSIFSFISILIALMGVCGIVFFETQYRCTEISIRRINGAMLSDIFKLFNIRFVKILVFCFVISVPIATYYIEFWLQSFAYKAPLYIWIYLLVFAAVSLLVISIVILTSWRTVTQNPVEVINKVQ